MYCMEMGRLRGFVKHLYASGGFPGMEVSSLVVVSFGVFELHVSLVTTFALGF
jgi:hypothetical protein